jgi:hypothetical protein
MSKLLYVSCNLFFNKFNSKVSYFGLITSWLHFMFSIL